MKTLNEIIQEVKSDFTLEECNNKFQEIAKLLLENYAVKNGDKIYRLLDIEFYFYNSNINDERADKEGKHVTYERKTPAGCWFFHDSGVDISFKSNKDEGYGGGILIRAIKQVEPEVKKAIVGSKLSYWEMFDEYTDAFKSTSPNPHIVSHKWDTLPEIHNSLRHGLEHNDKNKRNWRYFIDL